MPVSRPLGRARSKGSLVAKLFQPAKAAQKPDQPDCLNGLSTVNLIPDFGNCYLNQRMVLCFFCRRRLCAPGPAAAQGIVLHGLSNIMLIAFEALYQTMQLVLSKPDGMVQCPVSPDLRSRYLGWLDMYHDTHHLHSPQDHPREKATTNVGIVNRDRAHNFVVNVPVGMEHINERLNCLLLMRMFHRLFKTLLSLILDSPTSNLLLATLGPIKLYVFAHGQQQAYAALSRSVRSTRYMTRDITVAGRNEKRTEVLQSEGPTIGYGNVPFTTRSVSMLCDMEHWASGHSFQLHSVLQQQNASVQARVILPGTYGTHWTQESYIHGQSYEMTRNTSLVQNGDGKTKRVGGYSEQGKERHQRDTVQRQRSSTWPPVLTRKRQADSEESQDDDKRKRSGPGSSYKRRRLDNEKTPRFACPFFKYNPSRFADERACCGPGWSSVNRVKEHLYRRHSLPEYQCTRCFSNFKTNEELQDHSRQLQPCEIQDKPGILNGLDQEILSRLKMRPKKPSPISSSLSAEEQKWYNMFSIIFPGHALVPSPYYEPEDKGFSSLPSEAVAEEIFRKNLQETLPTWILQDTITMDAIMYGSISAFNKTFTAIHGQGTALLPDALPLEAATTSTTATSNIDRRLPVSGEASKDGNEAGDDSSRLFFLTPNEDTMAMFCDQSDYYTPSSTFHQTSGGKAETSEPPMQPPTPVRSWQPGSLPPPVPSLAAHVPSLTPQFDWPFQNDAIGHQDRNDFDKE